MGMKWRGLPDSPENLLQRQKKIVHSIKFWQDRSETEIRGYFRSKRPATTTVSMMVVHKVA
jgi:hypothetical protein